MRLSGNSIRVKILVPIFLLVAGITGILLFIIADTSHNVSKEYFEFILSNHASEVDKILETAITELISARLLDNSIVVGEKQNVVKEELVEYWKSKGLLGIIKGQDGNVLLASAENGVQKVVLPFLDREGPFHIEADAGHINGYTTSFPAWGWKVSTVYKPVSWLEEIRRKEMFFLLPVVLLGMGILLLSVVFILNMSFQKPVTNILSALLSNREIAETGITEFDIIVRAINDSFSRLRNKTDQFETLHDISISIQNQTRDQAINTVLEKVGLIFGSELSAFALCDKNGKMHNLFAKGSLPSIKDKVPGGRGILEYLFRSPEPLLINNVSGHPAFSGSFPEGHPVIENLISAQVHSGERRLGTLFFGNRPGGFTQEDMLLLRAISSDMSILLGKAENFMELERFKQVIDSSFNLIMIADEEGYITYANPACEQVTGYALREIIGKRIESYFGHQGRTSGKNIWNTVSAGKTWQGETLNGRKDGEAYYTSAVVFPIRSSESTIYASIQRDTTREKTLYEQLMRSQKLEALGTLAGGIAHDFNNMLTAIIGYASLLSMKVDPHSELKPFVNQILSSAEKSANLTQQLLAFGRKQIISPRQGDLNSLVRNIEKLLRRIIGEDIEFRTRLTDEELPVMVDAGQIEQVIINLCTNARDAVIQGGSISVSTEKSYLEDDFVKFNELDSPGMYAQLAVTDTGRGMDEKTRQRIFEPFFTTKEVGKGTGLGLSIVYGIVKQHGGTITVYSEPGRGTSFKVYLPLSGAKTEEPLSAEVHESPTGTETILIAEDNEDVRGLAKAILERHGYRTIEAVDGEDALLKFREARDRIQLILLDVIMPKKSGREVFVDARALKPGIKVLFTSGYTGDILHEKGFGDESLNFISKPVSPHKLLLKIREILDKA